MTPQNEPVEMNPVPSGNGVFHPGKEIPEGFRAGYVAIVGLPNVGKSTLMNTLLGQKISIVTPKPQTTRHRMIGIHSSDSHQIIFLDTPGLLKPRYLLHEFMMNHARQAMEEADLLLFMIDARLGSDESWLENESLPDRIRQTKTPAFLLLNKVDLIQKSRLLPLIETWSRTGAFEEIIPISALNADGTDRLLSLIIGRLPVHPPLYPTDTVSEHSEKFLVGEIIREKIFLQCKEEIPYSTTVDVTEFRERENRKTLIRAEIYVERTSQRGIIIGKRGVMLRDIGVAARKEIEDLIHSPVFLELHVKIREDWRQKRTWLERLGYG